MSVHYAHCMYIESSLTSILGEPERLDLIRKHVFEHQDGSLREPEALPAAMPEDSTKDRHRHQPPDRMVEAVRNQAGANCGEHDEGRNADEQCEPHPLPARGV